MKQQEIFKNALWLGAAADREGDKQAPLFPVLRGHFSVKQVQKATLYVLGLGFFHCYINGRRVGDDLFLPLSTDYEARKNFPPQETLTGHRIYVPAYDITSLLTEGENVIAIHFGGGWYTFPDAKFGEPKAIWRIFGESTEGAFEFVSSEMDRIGDSFVKEYYFPCQETHDYTALTDVLFQTSLTGPSGGIPLETSDLIFRKNFNDGNWPHAVPAPPLHTDYLFSDCPADRVCETLTPVLLHRTEASATYDATRNISGYPVLALSARKGEPVEVLFSEELTPDGSLDERHSYQQRFLIVSDGTGRLVRPLFTWFGFRYFTVTGAAVPVGVEVVHSQVTQTSHFKSDNGLLNWIHDAYVNTQLTNMHAGIPSDCPHIERRGYTGDGQLTCHAAMNILDARRFYQKWIQDILDCQDINSGHIQYTAPYTRCGGGPGGWGCAIVEVPYQYYMHYGDVEILKAAYPGMCRYFDYLEDHSYGKLVTRDKEGEWCLGDWCTPTSIALPAPFVNNYFYIKSLSRTIEIAKIIDREADIPLFTRRIQERREALIACYYNSWDGNFIGNLQGANAFAVDLGLGDERTYQNLVAYYRKLGHFDTGIFGTDVLTRVLFEHGDGQTAVNLLLSKDIISYDGMRRSGATTIWEYWPCSLRDRSRNHPMFGAIAAYLYDYLLGIRNKEGSVAYRDIVIAPVLVEGINRLEGDRLLPGGTVSTAYEKEGSLVSFHITIPEGQKAEFVCQDRVYPLVAGENQFRICL